MTVLYPFVMTKRCITFAGDSGEMSDSGGAPAALRRRGNGHGGSREDNSNYLRTRCVDTETIGPNSLSAPGGQRPRIAVRFTWRAAARPYGDRAGAGPGANLCVDRGGGRGPVAKGDASRAAYRGLVGGTMVSGGGARWRPRAGRAEPTEGVINCGHFTVSSAVVGDRSGGDDSGRVDQGGSRRRSGPLRLLPRVERHGPVDQPVPHVDIGHDQLDQLLINF